MKIAVEGCCHGELDKIYASIQYIQELENIKIDLLLICGDFQAIRNTFDLEQMAVPEKYRKMCDFHEYYSGLKKPLVPTIFIGGNHEASNYLAELYYGGFVSQDIYYLGQSGVIQFNGLRIGGISGIYHPKEYECGYFEQFPLSGNDLRSIYHTRRYEILKLSQIQKPLDVVLSHDWPQSITSHGNVEQLLSRKGFLKREIEEDSLGNPGTKHLLDKLQPKYWFSAHLHCKFPALVKHQERETRFLALDKCMPNKDFLQILDVDCESNGKGFQLDPEWLSILKTTNPHFSRQWLHKLPSTLDLQQYANSW
ncbi:Metallo-dependent phosphatase-like protein [Gorgonomyces haynaldii]|nr:Metallo-dependent phosphatase-like protein [Gorgonomyces haynaldii]